MNEDEFWTRLEFRLEGEMAGLPEKRHQHFWCDGFLPFEYGLEGPSPRITGQCWFGATGQDVWTFALLLPSPCQSREEINWASLLPADNMTRWMSFDEEKKYLEIDPAVAVPDLK